MADVIDDLKRLYEIDLSLRDWDHVEVLKAAIAEIERLRAAQVGAGVGAEIERLRAENKRLQEQATRLSTAELLSERDEADRRAGAAERRLEKLEEDARKRRQWLDNAKRSRGYPWTVSFDTVWAETCAKADANVGADVGAEPRRDNP